MISASLPLTEPDSGAYLLAAVYWLRMLVTGSIATLIAVLAVAAIGFLLLQGRMPVRRMGIVVIGCFIIFGSASLANNLMALSHSMSGGEPAAPIRSNPVPAPTITAPPQPTVYDPYAGASVPVR